MRGELVPVWAETWRGNAIILAGFTPYLSHQVDSNVVYLG